MSEQRSFHEIPSDDALKAFDATPNGLDSAQAEKRQQQYGENRLPEAPRKLPSCASSVIFIIF